MKRTRYQNGSVVRKKRKLGPDMWVFRYYADGARKSEMIGSVEKYKTKAAATKAAEELRHMANSEHARLHKITWKSLVHRYIAEELPARHTVAKKYKSVANAWIIPQWGEYPIADVKSHAIENWLKGSGLSPKSRKHVRSAMSVTYDCAIRWELVDPRIPNPMKMVRIPGCSKSLTIPKVLTAAEFGALIDGIKLEPFKTMVLVCGCLGLRSCELVGLKWSDFDFHNMTVSIQRGVVEGREGPVKTVYSQKLLPLAERLAEALKSWRKGAVWNGDDDWVFASPYHNGTTPYWPKSAMGYHVLPAAQEAKIGLKGWHTFRHTYSTLLRGLGVDIKVQQELLRHADIRTTMDGYTQGIPEQLRAANNLLVGHLVN